MTAVQHFLTLKDLPPGTLDYLIRRAMILKDKQKRGIPYAPLPNKVLGMIFEKSSTRTRVSFEAGMAQLGGHAIFLSPRDTQLGRGEPIEDSARVLSRMVDIIMIRTFEHEKLETFARYASVPVINALTDDFHPCQLLADIQTWVEHRGAVQGKRVAWIGDGNNMCHSYMNAATQFDFQLVAACPKGFEPKAAIVADNASHVAVVEDPTEAVRDADLVVTDVWASMGQEDEAEARKEKFRPYQVSPRLMDLAKPDALFMHCLPAHRGEEVSEDMLDDPRSVVWDEAENRLHAQKALMEYLLLGALSA
ncbi:ornithine carbamoyltransferase [Hahella sp. SMD15-11]|uniref:Ornithine carbamoyltransferase n=1 Tax=Thermohahella caldifontis TaxID=3142973 RepID=A0AB39V180_9GAMM